MKLGKTIYLTSRKTWRTWLAKHHRTEAEIWLVYYRKETGKPRISYNDAVEEALCYGWVDSIIKNLDKDRFAQRFSVRKSTSSLSQMNKERIRELIAKKKMTKAGLAAIAHVYNIQKEQPFVIPSEILNELKANKQAWNNFQKLPGYYTRIRVAYIESRKRHSKELYQKALRHFVEMTAKGKRFGFVKEMS